MTRTSRSHAAVPPAAAPFAAMLVGRSLFPIVALGLILGTLWWGPWVSLALSLTWWRIVTHYA